MGVAKFIVTMWLGIVFFAICLASSEFIHWVLFGEWWHLFVTPEGKPIF